MMTGFLVLLVVGGGTAWAVSTLAKSKVSKVIKVPILVFGIPFAAMMSALMLVYAINGGFATEDGAVSAEQRAKEIQSLHDQFDKNIAAYIAAGKVAPITPTAPYVPTEEPVAQRADKEYAKAETDLQLIALVDAAVQSDMIRRIDLTEGYFYVNGDVWNSEMTRKDKENFVKMLSKYRALEYKGFTRVSVYDATSNVLLAHGNFPGVTFDK